jgi:radical SAM superfamily enzyme YgiQ (UPF0313 family)
MKDLKVLFLYPNVRRMSLIPPSICLLSQRLKDMGISVDLFDTTFYCIDGYSYDSDDANKNDLVTRPYNANSKIALKDEDVYEAFNRKVEECQPDLIAVSVDESTFELSLSLLRAVRKHHVPTIAGGVFPTFAPEMVIRRFEIDILCIGEGELALSELCERLRRNQDYTDVSNLWVKQKNGRITRNSLAAPIDPDTNPMPDVGLFDESRHYRAMAGNIYRMMAVETHRGCPFTCGYCNSPAQNRIYREKTGCNYLRKRSLDRIHEELLQYRDYWKAEYIFFWADTFLTYSDREIDAFCEMYADIRLPFYCNAHPKTVSEYKIKKLKEVGLHRLGVGIEHGNEKFRSEVVNRRYSNNELVESLHIPKKYDIPFSANNIIGFPDETHELAMDTAELNRSIPASDHSCSIFQPYHGTALHAYAVHRGFIDDDFIAPANTQGSILNMPCFPDEEIRGLRRTFVMYTKFPKSRWPDIQKAEQLTPAGDAVWAALREEFIEAYFN